MDELNELVRNFNLIDINEATNHLDSMHLFTASNRYADNNCEWTQRKENIRQIQQTQQINNTNNKPATLLMDRLYENLREKLQEHRIVSFEVSHFQTYITDEEYDTDAVIDDLYSISKSNIMNKLHHIDEKLSNMKENDLKSDSFQNTICSLFHPNNVMINCPSLIRICKILTQYEIFINKQLLSTNDNNKTNIYQDIYAKIDAGYKDEHLLNDFNHLMHCHSTEFENVSSQLLREVYQNKPCNLSECLLMRRNQMDRAQRSQNKNSLKDLYFTTNEKEIISQQFIDRIHCYYFHSFDIGYRITQREKDNIISGDSYRIKWKVGSKVKIYSESQQIWKNGKIIKIYQDEKGEWLVVKYGLTEKEIQRFSKYIQPIDNNIIYGMSKLITGKRIRYRNVEGLERIYTKNNKYITEEQKIEEYRFGFRFFYHKYYEQNNDIYDKACNWSSMGNMVVQHPSNINYTVGECYVTPKYKTFKDELLNNAEKGINITMWNEQYLKAIIHELTGNFRDFLCQRKESAHYYEMNYGDGITTHHLIAMMIYCNFDELQTIFSQTFRRLNEKQTHTEFKERHRHFYFLGRLLREAVEVFGMKHNGNKNFTLYHGTNKMFKFRSLFAYFKFPCSTTTEYSVAQNFCDNRGAILELNIDTGSWLVTFPVNEGLIQVNQALEATTRITCLDMMSVSDYANEAEVFTIGGLNRFYFSSIFDAQTITNYEKYIKGIKQMTSGMTHGGISADAVNLSIPENKKEKQMVYRLMGHQLYKYVPDHEHAHEFKGCPQYILELMDAHCMDIRYITFTEQKQKVLDCILRDDDDWIRLNIVRKLFPNANHIKIIVNKKGLIYILDHILKPVLRYIEMYDEDIIPKINVSFDPKYRTNLDKLIERHYKQKFEKHGWGVHTQFVDPVDTWSKNSGYDIVGLIKRAEKNDQLKKMGDKLLRDFGWYDALKQFAIGAGIENFNIWRDYDKLSQALLWIVKN